MQRNNFSQLRLGDEIKGVLIITPSQVPGQGLSLHLSHPEHRVGGLNYFFYFPLISFQCAISAAPAGLYYCDHHGSHFIRSNKNI